MFRASSPDSPFETRRKKRRKKNNTVKTPGKIYNIKEKCKIRDHFNIKIGVKKGVIPDDEERGLWVMGMYEIIAIGIAGLALIISWRTSRTSNKLNKMEIKSREKEEADSKKAEIELAHVRASSGGSYFQLRNIGKSCAYNVEIEILDVNSNESLLASNQNKTFTEIHPSSTPVEIPSGVIMGSSDEFKASLCWEDGQGKHEETRMIPR